MDAVSEVLIARSDKNDALSSLVGASAAVHVVLIRRVRFPARGVVWRREQTTRDDHEHQSRRPDRTERRRPGDARRSDHSTGGAGRGEEGDRAGASPVGEAAGDGRADQSAAAKESSAERSRRRIREAPSRPSAKRSRRARASPRPGRKAWALDCRPAAAGPAAISMSRTSAAPSIWRRCMRASRPTGTIGRARPERTHVQVRHPEGRPHRRCRGRKIERRRNARPLRQARGDADQSAAVAVRIPRPGTGHSPVL